ncbi:MAG: DUF1493 family protein [Pseudomonadota bacterium]
MGGDPYSFRSGTTREDVLVFVEAETGLTLDRDKLGDLFADYGIDGAEAFAFIEAFGDRFNVDVTGYCYYFHHSDEAGRHSLLPWGRPDRHVRRIPVSADMLLDSVHRGTWDLDYPRAVMARAERRALVERRLIDGCKFGLLALLTLTIAWLWLSEAAACRPSRTAEIAC